MTAYEGMPKKPITTKPSARRPGAKRARAISVLVVDDHRTFAEAVATAVGLERGFRTRTAISGAEAIELAERHRPDVVMMDVSMPGVGGLEAIRRVREAHPGTRVIVLSGYDDDLTKGLAVEAGAIGYVSKETPVGDLPRLIRQAHAGQMLFEPGEMTRLLRVLRHRRHQEATERQRANRLTPRQIEILQLMADGFPVPQIADRLSLSPNTLRTHVQNILPRLAVHKKEEAIVVAIRHGKISSAG